MERLLLLLLLRLDVARSGGESRPHAETYVSKYEIIATYPHASEAFTQGLAFDRSGTLYESDGLYQHSAVRSVDPLTGQHIKRVQNMGSVSADAPLSIPILSF